MQHTPPLPFSRILLTGGNGFVGGHLLPRLTAATPGARRTLLVRPGSGGDAEGWDVASAEIDDDAGVEAIVRDAAPDLVLHLAAQSSVGAGPAMAEQTWRVNFDGSLSLASAVAKHAPDAAFLFVSSAETYGASFKAGPASEETPQQPQNAYARSKAAAEAMLADVLPASVRLIVARSFNHSGAGQDERFVLPSFAAQIARIEAGQQDPVLVTGNLEAERDFLDVADVCDAYLALLRAAPSLPMRSVFNVASGQGRRIVDLLAILRSHATVAVESRVDPSRLRPSDIPQAIGLNDRLREATGWEPVRTVEAMLLDLLEDARRRLAAP